MAVRRRSAPRRAAAASSRRGPRPASRSAVGTAAAVFRAAAEAFSARGFDSVGVDEIAATAGVNKAMIYYHFSDKLALYRAVVRDMLRHAAERVARIADQPQPAADRLQAFIAAFVELADARPWFPTLMLRELAEGGPHLDAETLELMRAVFIAFVRIVQDGRSAGDFGRVNPVLAYLSTIGPLLLNAARERAARRPGRSQLPMFVEVPHGELTAHMQRVALNMLRIKP
jgi:AcrR family transcriptional regulator